MVILARFRFWIVLSAIALAALCTAAIATAYSSKLYFQGYLPPGGSAAFTANYFNLLNNRWATDATGKFPQIYGYDRYGTLQYNFFFPNGGRAIDRVGQGRPGLINEQAYCRLFQPGNFDRDAPDRCYYFYE